MKILKLLEGIYYKSVYYIISAKFFYLKHMRDKYLSRYVKAENKFNEYCLVLSSNYFSSDAFYNNIKTFNERIEKHLVLFRRNKASGIQIPRAKKVRNALIHDILRKNERMRSVELPDVASGDKPLFDDSFDEDAVEEASERATQSEKVLEITKSK